MILKCSALVALVALANCATVSDTGQNTRLVQEATDVCGPYFRSLGERSRQRNHSAAFVVMLPPDQASPAANPTVPSEYRFVVLRVLSDAGGPVPTLGVIHDPSLLDDLGHPNNNKPILAGTVGLVEFERRNGANWSDGYVSCSGFVLPE